MKVLVGCEFSGVVRNAFRVRGHDAWSCDLLPAEDGSEFHFQCDVREVLDRGWELAIFHPPCTHLAVSGAKHFKKKLVVQREALEFFCELMNAPIHKICVENPVGVASTRIRPCDQIIHPWQFGDEVEKTTCLWLKNLPRLEPTRVVGRGEFMVLKSGKRLPKWYGELPPGPHRGKLRSRTFGGIAEAMADQWGEGQEYGLGLETWCVEVKNQGGGETPPP